MIQPPKHLEEGNRPVNLDQMEAIKIRDEDKFFLDMHIRGTEKVWTWTFTEKKERDALFHEINSMR